ncbi:hypothetical protein C8J57DRAFT_1504808 [Mycena rebaudengoi]|nr:hypothetical protein C8J57DRAFT_1504808 [Mycena rebaudengoi]
MASERSTRNTQRDVERYRSQLLLHLLGLFFVEWAACKPLPGIQDFLQLHWCLIILPGLLVRGIPLTLRVGTPIVIGCVSQQRHVLLSSPLYLCVFRRGLPRATKQFPPLPITSLCQLLTFLEKSGYGAGILDRRSNRAMRATLVDIDQQLTTLSLNDAVEGYSSTCSMSLVLKASAKPGDNITDFALNSPLAAGAAQDNVDILSAQYVCFQCALAMHQTTTSPSRLFSRSPMLTNGLATGTREWVKESEADEEVKAHQAGMRWMLENLVANVTSPKLV